MPLTTTTSTPELLNYRLPIDLKPFFYELEIQAYIGPEEEYQDKAFTYTGTNKMHFTCKKETNKIVFHALELVINGDDLVLTTDNQSIMQTTIKMNPKIVYDEKMEYWTVTVEETLKADTNYTLKVPYSGKILTKMFGFYQASYQENGKTQ